MRRNIISYPDKTPQDIIGDQPGIWPSPVGVNIPTPAAWAHSSVSTFGVRYSPPVSDLTSPQSVEALVEGSDMSMIREGTCTAFVLSEQPTDNFLLQGAL